MMRMSGIAVALVLLSGEATAQALVSDSQFTTSTGPNLENWAEPDGSVWDHLACTAAQSFKVASGSDVVSPLSSQYAVQCGFVVTLPVALSPDYYVQMSLMNAAQGYAGSFTVVFLRIQDASNFYAVGWYPQVNTADARIFKMVNGITTVVATGDCNISARKTTPSSYDSVRVLVQGDVVSLFRKPATGTNFVQCLTKTMGGSLTTAGRPGLGMGNYISTNDRQDMSLMVRDFQVYDLNGVEGPPPSAEPAFTTTGPCYPASGTAVRANGQVTAVTDCLEGTPWSVRISGQ